MEAILALNAGSSSVKFAVYEVQAAEPVLLLRGLLDRHAGDTEFIVKDTKRVQKARRDEMCTLLFTKLFCSNDNK